MRRKRAISSLNHKKKVLLNDMNVLLKPLLELHNRQ